MAVLQWKRWLGYAKSRIDGLTKRANDEMDRREAELEVERAERPWVRDDAPTPTLEDVKARMDAEARARGETPPPPKPSGDPAFDLAAQQKAADERLASIRDSLGLDGDDEKGR